MVSGTVPGFLPGWSELVGFVDVPHGLGVGLG